MSLEMIIGLVILLVVAAVVIKIFLDRMGNTGNDITAGELKLDTYRQNCQVLCDRYIDSGFAESEALPYCEKSFEIDINKDGRVLGEAGIVNAYGVCEDAVYCFNIKECNWGAGVNNHLSPAKCKAIMCAVYGERLGPAGTTAALIAERKENAANFIEKKIPEAVCAIETDPSITENGKTLGNGM